MWSGKLFALLFLVSAISAHPLEVRANAQSSSTSAKPSTSTSSQSSSTSSAKPTSTSSVTSTSTTSTKPTSTTSAKPTSTTSVKPTSTPASNATSLQVLFDGNKKFREGSKAAAAKGIAQQPPFMFLGCSDNRLSSGAIFQAPVGTVVSQNTIANQYFGKDENANAAVTYAIENLGVQHIIVLGHYGCKSVEMAINASDKPANAVEKWVKPITEMFSKSRRAEIKNLRHSRKPQQGKKDQAKAALKADDAGFKAVVEENVKESVKRLQKESVLAEAYKKKDSKKKVYVHGLVYDEGSGDVKDLRVSFGPPGEKVPAVPFAAVTAVKAQNKAKHLPGFFHGKKQPKKGPKGGKESDKKKSDKKKSTKK